MLILLNVHFIMHILVFMFILSVCCADNLFNYDLYNEVLDPELCDRQLESMAQFEFYDASFRVPQGILGGNLASLGNYHQCLAIDQDFPDNNIEGKYCLIRAQVSAPTFRIPSLAGVSASENVTWTEVTLNWPADEIRNYDGLQRGIDALTGIAVRSDKLDSSLLQSVTLSLAMCVPKSCTVNDVLSPYTDNPLIGLHYTEQYCRLPNDKPLVGADYAAIVIFSVIGVLTTISTAYELRHIFILKKDPKEANNLFRACSLYHNTGQLLSFTGNSRALDCIDGIRSLSILWIVIGHTFSVYLSNYVVNGLEMAKWATKRRALWIMSANVGVDTFLTLSGLLLVYTNAKKMKQMTLLKNLHLFYLNRLLRIFPLLAAAVLLQASLMHRISDGPSWHYMANQVDLCRRYWWSALLHVQNIFNSRERCLPHSWYLSVDMQLYIISPLVLFWVLGGRRAAWSSLTVGILASLAGTMAFCFVYDFIASPNAVSTTPDSIHDYIVFYYHNTVTRSPPFFIGMLFGYVLHVYRGQKIKLPKWSVVACYICALGLSFYAFFIVHPNTQGDWDSQFLTNINNSFRRPCWSLGLCWLIFACSHGYGGPVNWFLSLKLWKFLARISYAMYLFHYLVQYGTASVATAPVYFSMETMFSLFANDLVYTVVLSIAACVLIDAPFASLQKMLLGGASKPREKQNLDGIRSEPVTRTKK